jgi:hypothetical protein
MEQNEDTTGSFMTLRAEIQMMCLPILDDSNWHWAGTYGETGTSDTGVDFIPCGSDPNDKLNTFAKMPQLIAGHTYLLLVSHFTNTQSGYDLSFSGGTAVIKDPVVPHLETVEANCGSDQLRIKLDKSINCQQHCAGWLRLHP